MTTDPTTDTPAAQRFDDNQLIEERREKLAAIRTRGVAFPNDFKPKHQAAELLRVHGDLPNDELEPKGSRSGPQGRGAFLRLCRLSRAI